jgi:hypothetical protein
LTTTRYWRRPDVLWRRSLDAVILLPPLGDDPVTLAGTGPAIWELLTAPISVTQLVRLLAVVYGVDRHVIESDVVPVLDELVALGAVCRE